MQVNLNNNNPQFGMAFRKPANLEAFSKYANLKKTLPRRGVQQIVSEQANNKYFDIAMNEDNSVSVIKKALDGNSKDVVVERFPARNTNVAHQKINILSAKGDKAVEKNKNSDIKGLYYLTSYITKMFIEGAKAVINPKTVVRKNIYQAGEYATKLEKAQVAKNAANQKAIKSAEEMFK